MSYCIKCGFKNEPAAKFCTRCGTRLVAPATASADAAVPFAPLTQPPPPAPVGTAGTQSSPQSAAPDIKNALVKNRKLLLTIAAVLVVGWAVNHFFFKPHPQKDGKAAAEAVCDCEKLRVQSYASQRKAFLQNFDTYRFTSLSEARQKLDSFNMASSQQYTECLEKTRLLQEEKVKKYATDQAAATVYAQAFVEQQQLCRTEQDEEQGRLETEIANRFSNFKPYTQAAPPQPEENKPEEQAATAPIEENTPPAGALTDDFIKGQIGKLYGEENGIGSSEDAIYRIMSYYDFPLDKYYDKTNVSSSALFKLYSDSYFKTLAYHKVDGYQDKITLSRQTDGSVKVIVGCTFEFSTSQSPDNKRTRTAYNVYIFGENGKIKSVYQLM